MTFSSDCANFVSQALRAGGWPFANFGIDVTSPYAWYYDNKGTSSTSDDKYSHTWSVAKKLYTFIVLDSNPRRGKNATTSPYPGTTSDPYPDNTTIGDVIFYDWNGDAEIDHVSIYVANGTDPDSGYSGALVDQHTSNRYHAIWSLSPYNRWRNTTKIYPVELYTTY
ncbi:amidase domain-containing protein [Thermovorax subterraneus]|nr:amidase domain-containing protein [Thermovorax subterraneus]